MMAGAATHCGALQSVWGTGLEKSLGPRPTGGAASNCSSIPPPCASTASRLPEFRQWSAAEAVPKPVELRQGKVHSDRLRVRCSAATLADAPLANAAEDGSGFCGDEGTVLQRPPVQLEGAEGQDKKYLIHTFGCQMNSADSERMAGVLEGMGYSSTDDLQTANIIVYNTCSIRDKAEQKVYSHLGRVTPRKKKDPSMRIIVAGCVAQQEGEQMLRRVPQVDLVMGPQHANRLQELLEQVDLGSQICATEPIHIIEDIAKPKRDSLVTAWVNVIYGCNECCTYCVVPGVRGKEQSRQPEAIRREMLALGEAGYKEVTLLGQNIDAYGRDLPGFAEDGSGRRRWTFTDLLRYVHDVPGIERIRFTTSHPRYFSERLIKAIAELPKVCKFFNIPFQSGDNQILKDMKRGYTIERYCEIIAKVRRYVPDASFSTDIIVGFPGETEEQFQNSVRMVRELGFDTVNTAAYSQRPNTPAAEWECQVADLIKADRLHRINRVVQEEARKRTHRYLGRREKVLVEAVDPKAEGVVIGRTDGNRLCHIEGGTELIGHIVEVDIVDTFTFSLRGRLVNEASARRNTEKQEPLAAVL